MFGRPEELAERLAASGCNLLSELGGRLNGHVFPRFLLCDELNSGKYLPIDLVSLDVISMSVGVDDVEHGFAGELSDLL